MYPWPHSWPMDKRDPDARVGKICTHVASGGSCDILRLVVWVEVMVSLLGSNTSILVRLGWMSCR